MESDKYEKYKFYKFSESNIEEFDIIKDIGMNQLNNNANIIHIEKDCYDMNIIFHNKKQNIQII